jgi:maleate isomerase
MIGWRARLGILVPSANIVMEPDMYRMIPEGVTAHFARVWITEDTPEELEKMIDYVPQASIKLSHALVDVYGFGCTSGSLIKGLGYDKEIIAKIEKETEKPATTTASACIQVFKKQGIEKISLATPYEKWLNKKERLFFEGNGVQVVAMDGMELPEAEAIASVDPGQIYRMARAVDRPESDAIFISCTDFRAVEVIQILEQDLGKPVFTSNQVTLWAMLRLAGVKSPIHGYGRLLENI